MATRGQETGHVLVFDDRDSQLLHLIGQGVEDGPAGVVTRVTGAPIFMGAKETLIQPTVLERREAAAPGGQLAHRIRSLPRHDFDHPRVSEEVTLAQRVGEMLLPGVLRIARAQHRVDAARGQDGMRIEAMSLAHDQNLASGLGGGDRGAQPGRASPDDEDVADPATGRRFWHLPWASYSAAS